MTNEKLSRILDDIRTIKLDGEFPPRQISELDELINFGGFSEVIRKVELNELQLNIPNHKLYEVYNYVVPKKERVINRQFLNIPYLLALSISIYGIVIGNYWLLTLLPTVFISTLLSSIFGGVLFYLITLAATFYLFYSDHETIGFITLTVLVTVFCSHYLRIHRRNSLLKMGLVNEEIFAFLFYSKTLSVYDRSNDKLIYSGMKY